MRRGKFQKRKSKFPAVLLAVLILAALGASFGGVRAYLFHTVEQPLTNSFTADSRPTIAVGSDYKVTVSNTNYAVYLRAAVVVNWKSDSNNNLLAALPVAGTDYTIGSDWIEHEGFYYYTKPVTNGQTTSPILSSLSTSSKTGYTLVAEVAVQAIQAVGQTDGDSPIDAVEQAWGITADTIKGNP